MKAQIINQSPQSVADQNLIRLLAENESLKAQIISQCDGPAIEHFLTSRVGSADYLYPSAGGIDVIIYEGFSDELIVVVVQKADGGQLMMVSSDAKYSIEQVNDILRGLHDHYAKEMRERLSGHTKQGMTLRSATLSLMANFLESRPQILERDDSIVVKLGPGVTISGSEGYTIEIHHPGSSCRLNSYGWDWGIGAFLTSRWLVKIW